jgi:hypothetical protein
MIRQSGAPQHSQKGPAGTAQSPALAWPARADVAAGHTGTRILRRQLSPTPASWRPCRVPRPAVPRCRMAGRAMGSPAGSSTPWASLDNHRVACRWAALASAYAGPLQASQEAFTLGISSPVPFSMLGVAGMARQRCPRPTPSPALARAVPPSPASLPCHPRGLPLYAAPVLPGPRWARSSAVEHYLDMVGVTGSIPVAPTISGRLRDTGL